MPVNKRTRRTAQAISMGQTRTTTTKRTKRRRNGVRSLKTAVMTLSEAKHNTNHAANAMTGLGFYYFSPTQAVQQGTTRQGRIGDEIYLEALKIRGFINTDTEANAYSFRLLVIMLEQEYSNAAGTAGSVAFTSGGISRSDLFQDNTGVAPYVAGVIDAKRVNVLFDKTYDVMSQLEDIYDLVTVSETIQIQKRFPYRTEGGAYGKNTNLYIVIIPYHLPKSGHTTYGGFTIDTDLIFKE